MFRDELEHLIRAGCRTIEQDQVIVIGSQSILATYGEWELPEFTTRSMEADMRAVIDDSRERLADIIDGSIGEFSLFHQENGFYAQGVGSNTAVLPDGWADRLVPVSNANTQYFTGWCLEPHDLVISKLIANREKDHAFAACLIEDHLVSSQVLRDRLAVTDADPEQLAVAAQFIDAFPDTTSRYVTPELPAVDLESPNHPRNLLNDASRNAAPGEQRQPSRLDVLKQQVFARAEEIEENARREGDNDYER